jgi:hypothetical protein
MQTSHDYESDLATVSIGAIGGEPLDESGFQSEEPNSGFYSELGGKE